MDPTASNAAQLAAIRRAHDERWRRAHPEEAAARDSARDALAAARDDRPTASPPLPTLAPGQTEYPRAFDAENESDDPTADPSSDGDADPSSGEHAPRRATTAASDEDEDDRRGVLFGAGLAAGLVGWQALSAARTVARALGTLPVALQRERALEALARVRPDAVRRARDASSADASSVDRDAAEASSRAAREREDAALAERLQREEREAAILERSAARASAAAAAGEDPDVFEASARLDAITRLDASVPSLANLADDDAAAAAAPPSDPEDLDLEGVRMSRQAAIGYLLSDPTEGGADDPSSDATHPLVAAVASRLRTFASAVSDGDETDLARHVDDFLDALGDIDAAVEEAMPSPSSFASGDGDGGVSGASSGGLSASAIRGLPTRTYRARTDGGSADEPPHCAVCLCDAEEGEEIKTLPCAHRFHAKCVDRWLRGHRSCPMCKSDAGARALAARDEAPEATRYRRAPTSRRSGAVASAR